jgi:hypothetical protein
MNNWYLEGTRKERPKADWILMGPAKTMVFLKAAWKPTVDGVGEGSNNGRTEGGWESTDGLRQDLENVRVDGMVVEKASQNKRLKAD